jgi:hypothetical protein
VQRELVGEGDERGSRVRSPQSGSSQIGVARRAEGDRLGPGPFVADQRRARDRQLPNVVAMVMVLTTARTGRA